MAKKKLHLGVCVSEQPQGAVHVPQGLAIGVGKLEDRYDDSPTSGPRSETEAAPGLPGCLGKQRQTQADPLSLFCGEKRVKGAARGLGRHSRPVVLDLDGKTVAETVLVDVHGNVPGAGPQRVLDHVEQV